MTILTNLMPPAFTTDTLSQFSTQTGRPGTQTYEDIEGSNATISFGDSDFETALRIVKPSSDPRRLRYMAETPIVPGRYIRVSVRVKLDTFQQATTIRIAAYAGLPGGGEAVAAQNTGPAVTLQGNDVAEISAVIGTGERAGVDMVWTPDITFAHVGFDILGSGVSAVLVESLVIEDVTSVYAIDSTATVDVRDFGAIGDGNTDCSTAFEAADAAANGRTVLVPPGSYVLSRDMAFENPVQFQGTLSMAASTALILKKNFELKSYSEAFGSDEEGFKRALAAMLVGSDHNELDLCGRVISLTRPIKVRESLRTALTVLIRYRIHNGTFRLAQANDPVWDPDVYTVQAGYSVGTNNIALTNINAIDQIETGTLVKGPNVGREVYVSGKSIAGKQAFLNLPLRGNPGTQTYTLTRYKYMLDFSGLTEMRLFEMDNIEFACDNAASAVMLPPAGSVWRFSQCYFNSVGHRAITSPGYADQGMLVDNCNFTQNVTLLDGQRGVAINSSQNDIKIRHNRGQYFQNFAVIAGQNALVLGNHIFQGGEGASRTRSAGFVFSEKSVRTTIDGNYIDNCFLEFTNEHSQNPGGGFDYGSINITANNFYASGTNENFRFIHIVPLADTDMTGLNVNNNLFSIFPASSTIDRVEKLDETNGRVTGFSRIGFSNNAYVNVAAHTSNPRPMKLTQNTAQSTWVADFADSLPFGKGPSHVDAIVPAGRLTNSGGSTRWPAQPQVDFGGSASQMRVYWSEAVRGEVTVTARMDDPDG